MLFSVGVDGVEAAEAAEACRRVFTLDVMFGRRSTFPCVSYLPQLWKHPQFRTPSNWGKSRRWTDGAQAEKRQGQKRFEIRLITTSE